jgi:hypothetical protein
MTSQQEIEIALGASTDCLRIAAQSLEINGSPIVAQFLREQADKNISLLLPWVKQ